VKRCGSTLKVYETFAAISTLAALVRRSVRSEGRCDGEESKCPRRAVLTSETSITMPNSGSINSDDKYVRKSALVAWCWHSKLVRADEGSALTKGKKI
jgi:hypothetical protein